MKNYPNTLLGYFKNAIATESNPAFSETCYWTLKKPEDVKPEECKKEQEDLQ